MKTKNRAILKPTAKPLETERVPAGPEARPYLVRVRVGRQPLNEEGFRAPGTVFETTAARRRALGSLVEDVNGGGDTAATDGGEG
jgi:hypothetical protein